MIPLLVRHLAGVVARRPIAPRRDDRLGVSNTEDGNESRTRLTPSSGRLSQGRLTPTIPYTRKTHGLESGSTRTWSMVAFTGIGTVRGPSQSACSFTTTLRFAANSSVSPLRQDTRRVAGEGVRSYANVIRTAWTG